MANEPYTRPVPAPPQEWLTRQELRNALDLGDRALDKMIKAGRFPRGTPWDGKEHRWRWWVVVWYRLQKDVEPLLLAGPLDDDDEASDPPHEEKVARK